MPSPSPCVGALTLIAIALMVARRLTPLAIPVRCRQLKQSP
jgi:hypothetical protein